MPMHVSMKHEAAAPRTHARKAALAPNASRGTDMTTLGIEMDCMRYTLCGFIPCCDSLVDCLRRCCPQPRPDPPPPRLIPQRTPVVRTVNSVESLVVAARAAAAPSAAEPLQRQPTTIWLPPRASAPSSANVVEEHQPLLHDPLAVSQPPASDPGESSSTRSAHSDTGHGLTQPLNAPKAHRKPRLIYPTKVLEARAEARQTRQRAKAARAAEAQAWREEMERPLPSRPQLAGGAAARKAPARKPSRGGATPDAVHVVEVLQDGWLKLAHSADATSYFYHPRTGETTWVRPSAAAALPDGWIELIDRESGASYFHCAPTGVTTWRRPAEQTAEADVMDGATTTPGPAPAEAVPEVEAGGESGGHGGGGVDPSHTSVRTTLLHSS